MKESNPRAADHESKIQCIEVLVPKNSIASSGHNLHWTLSVYSLENQPVSKNRSFHNSEIFHFMVYDWKRTIKQLLEDHQIHYSIIQYFTPETVLSETRDLGLSGNETGFFSSLDNLDVHTAPNRQQKIDLIFDERSH